LVHRAARSADHLDSPAVVADPAIDIADVYTWMDGSNFVAAMTLYPAAGTGTLFSDSAQYVIHTTSGATYGATSNKYDIICTFTGTAAPQTVQCWGGTNEYVTGDPSGTSGISSKDGSFKVFAAMRADPFHFNLAGFKNTVATVQSVEGSLTFYDSGCPILPPTGAVSAATLRSQLATQVDGGPAVDFFQSLNALAIVISINKTLVTAGGPIVSVWGATYGT
jgi:hypothetical protein